MLSREDREEFRAAGNSLVLSLDSSKDNILHDRKAFLRFARAVMGTDGLGVLDYIAQSAWSRGCLEDELSHDADLDISQIHALHMVTKDDKAYWLHSHGLERIGFFDFDILNPSVDLNRTAMDGLRALAFAIVEGSVTMSTPCFRLGQPRGKVRFVPIQDFIRSAPSEASAMLKEDSSVEKEKRSVLCDPATGLFARWSKKIRPSRFLSGDIPDGTVFNFSGEATTLMEQRARNTYPIFRTLVEEMKEFEFPGIVKLGYPIDGGQPDEREHMWFSVHECFDDAIEATLENTPHQVKAMKPGERKRHSIDLLTDWIIFTPFGQINPRFMALARQIRLRREELRQLMREHIRS